jgi:hypothetical protein
MELIEKIREKLKEYRKSPESDARCCSAWYCLGCWNLDRRSSGLATNSLEDGETSIWYCGGPQALAWRQVRRAEWTSCAFLLRTNGS